MFLFFQSPKTSADSQEFSKVMKGGLANTSASSLRTLWMQVSGLHRLVLVQFQQCLTMSRCRRALTQMAILTVISTTQQKRTLMMFSLEIKRSYQSTPSRLLTVSSLSIKTFGWKRKWEWEVGWLIFGNKNTKYRSVKCTIVSTAHFYWCIQWGEFSWKLVSDSCGQEKRKKKEKKEKSML